MGGRKPWLLVFSKVSHDCMLYTLLVAQPSLTHTPMVRVLCRLLPMHYLFQVPVVRLCLLRMSPMDQVCCTDCTVQAVQPPTPSSPWFGMALQSMVLHVLRLN